MARFRRAGKTDRRVRWLRDDPFSTTGSTGTDALVTIASAADFEQFNNPTIVRIRGQVSVHLIKTDADQAESIDVMLGIRVQDEQVIAAGDLRSSNVLDAPWMWLAHAKLYSVIKWEPAANSSGTVISLQPTTMTVDGVTHRRFEVDVKAMRRVPQNHSLVLCWTWAQVDETADLNVNGQLSCLVQE